MGGPTTQRCQHYMKRVVGEKIGGSAKGATSTHTKSYFGAEYSEADKGGEDTKVLSTGSREE